MLPESGLDIGVLGPANICLSGGADGADLQWGMLSENLGHVVIHWGFVGYRTNAPKEHVVVLNEDQLKEADPYLERASKGLKRYWPASSEYTRNLLRRNWFQINQTQSVYAVAPTDHDMSIKGGTAWAVQMYLDRFIHDSEPLEKCQCYLFDMSSNCWWQWKGDWKIISQPPKPAGIWTGIGSRDLSTTAKWRMRKLMGGYELGALQMNALFPIVEEPNTDDIIYIDDIREPGRGLDDQAGGWATVRRVVTGPNGKKWISCYEFTGNREICWDDIKDDQVQLRVKFGTNRAYPKPNLDPAANSNIPEYRLAR